MSIAILLMMLGLQVPVIPPATSINALTTKWEITILKADSANAVTTFQANVECHQDLKLKLDKPVVFVKNSITPRVIKFADPAAITEDLFCVWTERLPSPLMVLEIGKYNIQFIHVDDYGKGTATVRNQGVVVAVEVVP